MEKHFKIKTSNKKYIYGRFNGAYTKPVILIVHGLGGNLNEAVHYNAVRYFNSHGFSVCRFNLYDEAKDARTLRHATLHQHGQDIDTVVEYIKNKGARRLYVAGHSYGFPSILQADCRSFSAIASWDGSYLPELKNYFRKQPYIPSLRARLLDWGVEVIIGEPMVKEESRINQDLLIQNIGKPLLVVGAQKGNITAARKIYKLAQKPKKFYELASSDHNFTQQGVQEKLFRVTADWFKSYI